MADVSFKLAQPCTCSQVRKNLHVVLCFSPVGDKFRIWARQFPALINCTVVDWWVTGGSTGGMVCLESPCCSACGNAAAPKAPLVNDMQVPCMAGGGTGQRGPPLLIRCPPGIRGSAGANCATHGLCPPVCDRRQPQVSRGAQLLAPYHPGRPNLRPGNSAGSSFSCTKCCQVCPSCPSPALHRYQEVYRRHNYTTPKSYLEVSFPAY